MFRIIDNVHMKYWFANAGELYQNMTGTTSNIVLNLFCVAVLLLIVFFVGKQRYLPSLQSRLFIVLCVLIMTVLLLDSAISFLYDKTFSGAYVLVNAIFYAYFLAQLSLMVVWCFYIQKRYDGKPKWLFYTLISILTLSCLGAIIANGFTNILFTIDKTENTYIRGPFIVAYSSAFSLFVLAPIATIIFNRKNIVKNEMFSFLVATISPIIGAIIQLLLPPMVSVIYPTVTFGVLVVFVYFSKTELQVDYLTGVNNRKQLTLTANQIIGKAHRKQYLVGVMVDINKFKVINDTYGHSEGDEALILASRLLSESTKKGEFLARYGGDEFVIPYEDDTLDEVDELKKRINNKTTNFNISKTKPYQINFSIGSMVFSKDEELDVDKFIQEIDKKMYENKRS